MLSFFLSKFFKHLTGSGKGFFLADIGLQVL
jgi:hypothetical protein